MKFLLVLALLLVSGSSQAGDAKGKTYGKDLKFDDEVLEGMNKIPARSAESTALKDKKDNSHLYTKRAHFNQEAKRVVQEMRMTP